MKPKDDQEVDPIKTVTLKLSPPDGYLISDDEATAYLAIADNEGDALLAKTLNEPNFKDQWCLWNTPDNPGTAGVDLNVLEVWQDYSGKGVKIGMLEPGLVADDHPDLKANYDPAPNPNPNESLQNSHATAVAGIVTAEAGNGLGGVGVAHGSTITSFSLSDSEVNPTAAENYLRAQLTIDVFNNSWGGGAFSVDFTADNEKASGLAPRCKMQLAMSTHWNHLRY